MRQTGAAIERISCHKPRIGVSLAKQKGVEKVRNYCGPGPFDVNEKMTRKNQYMPFPPAPVAKGFVFLELGDDGVVVRRRLAMEPAFRRAMRSTFVGTMTPMAPR
jgi:hypothetical protein